MKLVWISLLCLAAGVLTAGAAPLKKPGVEVELVSEVKSLRPGQAFRVGLRLKHEAGWHTYWRQQDPEVGVPTALEWVLPEGFTAGEIEWPVPEVTHMAKYLCWGYEREVVLPVVITPPATLDPAKTPSISLKAKARWMCCATTCHPGFEEFTLSLPVSANAPAPAEFRPLFLKACAERPLRTEAWKMSAERAGGEITLRLVPGAGALPPSSLFFACQDSLVWADFPQTLTRQPDGTLSLVMKVSEMPPKEAKRLQGVVVSAEGWLAESHATGLVVDVELTGK